MSPPAPFVRHLLGNLRISFFVTVVALGIVLGYALLTGGEASWEIVIFVAIGMAISSLVNAAYDARKQRDTR